jgi:hypothetical protein
MVTLNGSAGNLSSRKRKTPVFDGSETSTTSSAVMNWPCGPRTLPTVTASLEPFAATLRPTMFGASTPLSSARLFGFDTSAVAKPALAPVPPAT